MTPRNHTTEPARNAKETVRRANEPVGHVKEPAQHAEDPDRHAQKPVRYGQYHLKHTPVDNSTKIILLATSFRMLYFVGNSGSEIFERQGCSYDCFITNDHTFLNRSAAVLFHGKTLGKDMPSRPFWSQRWVFFLLESPIHLRTLGNTMNDKFNWTMMYRLDSDIPLTYGKVTKKSTAKLSARMVKTSTETKNMTAIKKKKLISWMVSNCHTPSKREKYVRELQKYINVDIYGACGNMKCPKKWTQKDSGCMGMIGKTYKFYLAFENSLCKDYVTEKFFKAFSYNLVPVVRGEANYTKYIPPGYKWFINSADFQSPKELADYLLYLDNNPTEYAKYLEGREHYDFHTYFNIRDSPAWCDLCEKLHHDNLPVKVYKHIDKWWSTKDCHSPKDMI